MCIRDRGSNALQLGRGANKIVLDGGTGNVNAPGDCMVGSATTQQYGRLGHNVNHAILFRGLTTSGFGSSYTVTAAVCTTFDEWGGTWYFREVNPTTNSLLFEINTSNVLYRNIPLQTTPFISCRINSTNPITITNNRGRVTPGAFLAQAGQWKLTFTHPAGADFVPHVTLCPPIGETGMIAAWPHTAATLAELFVATSTVTGSPQTYSFYITIF